jgi:hypothetical protein
MRFGLLMTGLMACQPMVAGVVDGGLEVLASAPLIDVNPASATAGQGVSLDSLRDKVSGWYFTHTT